MAAAILLFRKKARAFWSGSFAITLNLLAIAIADRVAGPLLNKPRYEGDVFQERVIRLRQLPAYLDEVRSPGASYCEQTDTLANRPVRLRTDGNGLIMPSAIHAQPDAKIVFLGGSTTECIWVSETNRFPFLIGRRLEAATGLRVNSYNAGKGGNNSLHSLDILLNEILPLRPDAVVFMENINDLNILLFTGSYWNDRPTRSPLETIKIEREPAPGLRTLVSNAAGSVAPYFYAAIKTRPVRDLAEADEWRDLRGKKLVFNADEILAQFSASLRMFISICRHRGVTPVLMTQQNRFTRPPDPFVERTMKKFEADFGIAYGPYLSLYAAMNETIRAAARDDKILLIDLDAAIPKSREFIYDTVHFNDAGSQLAAQIIAQELRGLPVFSPRDHK